MSGKAPEEMHILVLEASTTSAKAMLFGGGKPVVLTKPYPSMGADATVHDVDVVVAVLTQLARRVTEGTTVDVVALVGAWHGLLLADHSMRPVSPAYLWSNTEPAAICRRLRADQRLVNWFYQATGCMVNATYPIFTLHLLRERGVNIEDAYIIDEGSYLNWVLTGEFAQSHCLASGSGLLNTHSKRYDADVLAWAGVTQDQLPTLVPSLVPSPLSARGAALLGIPEGTPVLPTIADGAANQAGSGALRPSVMTLSVGTSGAVRLATDAPRLPQTPSTWCYVSTHSWLSGAATSGGCNCIDWFRGGLTGGLSYRELETQEVSERDPVFLPFLHGERCPGWDDGRRAEFMGMSAQNDLRTLYGAVQEGVLFNLLQCYQALIELNGRPLRIKLSGGILHSPRWTQMCADIFGVPLEKDAALHASLMGGAICGMEAIGLISTAADFETKPSGIVIPNPEAHGRHQKRYRAYLRAYHG